jgi:hypothetical protein
MKAYGGVEVKLNTFHTFTIYQGCPFHGLHAACQFCVRQPTVIFVNYVCTIPITQQFRKLKTTYCEFYTCGSEAAHNNSCGSLLQLLDAPALDGGECSASHSNHFTTGETVSDTH